MPKDLYDLKMDYLEYLEVELHRSQKTIQNYDHYLERFVDFVDTQCPTCMPSDITMDIVRKYRVSLNRRKVDRTDDTLRISTQNYHAIALRNFLKYLAKNDIPTLAAEKIDIGKNPEQPVTFLEDDELVRLVEAADGTDWTSLRDRAIVELLFSAGLRVSEIVALDRDSINLERQEFSVRGKGGAVRIVFISDAAKKSLENYLQTKVI